MATLLDTQTRFLESSADTGFGDWGFIGQETYGTTEKAALAESMALRGRRWPGVSGINAPVCTKTRIIYAPDAVPGYEALIIATYETPKWAAILPGRAILTVEITPVNYVAHVDLDRKVVDGPDADGVYWQLAPGSEGRNTKQYLQSILSLETTYVAKDFRLARVLALEGKVNAKPLKLKGFGTMQAESCKCLGVETSIVQGETFVKLKYKLQWSGPDRTWNQVEVLAGQWLLFNKEIFNRVGEKIADVADLRKTAVEFFVPGWLFKAGLPAPGHWVKSTRQRRRLYETADFSMLQSFNIERTKRVFLNTSLWQGLVR